MLKVFNWLSRGKESKSCEWKEKAENTELLRKANEWNTKHENNTHVGHQTEAAERIGLFEINTFRVTLTGLDRWKDHDQLQVCWYSAFIIWLLSHNNRSCAWTHYQHVRRVERNSQHQQTPCTVYTSILTYYCGRFDFSARNQQLIFH